MSIKTFKQITKDDVLEVGGKGASLGEMTQLGIPVPPGFVITTDVYKRFSKEELPVDIEAEILQAFDQLHSERVAVRSSAVAEDSAKNSWAGQLESYLNVPRDQLIARVRGCWNSIYSERALAYAGQQSLSEDQLAVAVVVQKMVKSEVSGVMFTINPVTKAQNEIMIEAGFGLGEYLVQGMITPDNFVLGKESLEMKSVEIQTQERMLVSKDGANVEIKLSNSQGSQAALSAGQLQELAKVGLQIEKHFGVPCDIEWAWEKGKFYILQSRPITT